MKPRFLIILACVCWTACAAAAFASTADCAADTVLGCGPGEYRIESGAHSVRIPFEMFRRDIRMNATVNGRPARLMLDNGHLWDDLLFFGSTRVDSLELQREAGRAVGGSGEGDKVSADEASDIAVGFPGVTFTGQDAVITHYDPDLPNMWEGAEGQISSAFFKHFVTAIDYEAGVITLTEPEHFRYEGDGVELPLIPLPLEAWAVPGEIELADGRSVAADLMLDIGYGKMMSIVVSGPHGIRPPDNAIPATLGFGMQGPIRGHHGRVRAVTLGGHRLENALVDFVEEEGAEPYTEIMVGMETFRRFHVVFDYPGRRLILEPNGDFDEPSEYDMSGLFLRPSAAGEYGVTRVLPNSPASDAGIVAGDVVTRFDDQPSAELPFWDLQPLLRREGASIKLTIRRREQEHEVVLVLRRMI